MRVQGFHDGETGTITYLVVCPTTASCAVIDPVLGFDPVTGHTSDKPLRPVLAAMAGLTCEWVLETHIHADHLSGATTLRAAVGGRLGIGAGVVEVERNLGKLFNFGLETARFDHLFSDGERFSIGTLKGEVLATPGHTPDSLSYLIGDTVFVGDTLFMPDSGTARCDFPGGDAAMLYASIQRILALPPATRIMVCHDYKAPGRDAFAWETTVAEQRAKNIHVHDGVGEAEYTALRRGRDATLAMPRLMLPSVQVNLRAGAMPEPEGNGIRYIRIPIDAA